MSAHVNLILRIWRQQPGKFFFLSTKSRAGDWKDHPFKRQAFGEVAKFVEANSDKDLYFCPHGFIKPRRLKQYAELPKLLWADLDEVDPRELGPLMPTIAWESSPGRFACLWFIDQFMTEDANRRLTYHIDADRGGWDISQVLRIPGTRNYKYESAPLGKLLWGDGQAFELRPLLKLLPKEPGTKDTGDRKIVLGIYRKYESKFSGWVRRTLFKGKPKPGKRSEVLWKLTQEMLEAGCTKEEMLELLRASPWNKFVKRRNGDEQLKREIDKATSQHLQVRDDEEPRDEMEPDESQEDGDEEDDEPYKFLAKSMAEVEEENLDWIWYPYLARGEVTILEGDPGLGKSYLAQMVSSAVCDGVKLPSQRVKKLSPVQGKVAYFDIENAAGAVTKKRLVGNGCKTLTNFFQEQEPFSVADDDALEQVYDAIDNLRPTLVVFDTINTYLGNADTHQATEVQQTFRKFGEIARRFNCSVLVLRHLTKSSKGVSALYRGQGSISFAGFARIVMTVGKHPEEEDVRVMAVTKINVVKPPKAITFTIEELPPTLRDDDRSKFLWGDFVDLTSDQILVHSDGAKQDAIDLDDTVQWLEAMLDGGPKKSSEIAKAGEPRGISDILLRRAATKLGVVHSKTSSGVVWSMPEKKPDAGEA